MTANPKTHPALTIPTDAPGPLLAAVWDIAHHRVEKRRKAFSEELVAPGDELLVEVRLEDARLRDLSDVDSYDRARRLLVARLGLPPAWEIRWYHGGSEGWVLQTYQEGREMGPSVSFPELVRITDRSVALVEALMLALPLRRVEVAG